MLLREVDELFYKADRQLESVALQITSETLQSDGVPSYDDVREKGKHWEPVDRNLPRA